VLLSSLGVARGKALAANSFDAFCVVRQGLIILR